MNEIKPGDRVRVARTLPGEKEQARVGRIDNALMEPSVKSVKPGDVVDLNLSTERGYREVEGTVLKNDGERITVKAADGSVSSIRHSSVDTVKVDTPAPGGAPALRLRRPVSIEAGKAETNAGRLTQAERMVEWLKARGDI